MDPAFAGGFIGLAFGVVNLVVMLWLAKSIEQQAPQGSGALPLPKFLRTLGWVEIPVWAAIGFVVGPILLKAG